MVYRVTFNTCKHMGQEPDFTKTWWCNLQHDDPTKVHFDCDCKNCPDFEPIVVESESFISLGTEPFTPVRTKND